MNQTTTQSRAFRMQKLTGIDGLTIGSAPIPTPAPGEVLVHVRATSLNFRDLIILQGHYPLPIPAGRIPLSDGAGEVVAVGEGVTQLHVGDRVANAFFPDWIDGPYAGGYSEYAASEDGWLTDYRAISADALIRIADDLGFEEAATLPCAGVTAWSALKGVQPGDNVLTLGTGGVSLFAVQLARAMGARVIATTSSDAKAERLKALGAEETINYRTQPEWSQRVLELTGGKGVERIVEVGGPGTFEQSVKAIAVSGQVSMVGVVAGMQGSVDFMSMFTSRAIYRSIALGSRQDLEELVQFITEHKISPVIDSRHPFDDSKRAFERLATRNVFGKVVISH